MGGAGNNAPISTSYIPNVDDTPGNTETIPTNKKQDVTQLYPPSPNPPKQTSLIGTVMGGVAAVSVTTVVVAGYMLLTARKQPNSLHSTSSTGSGAIYNNATTVAVPFERFSLNWWRHRLAAMIKPTTTSVVPSAEYLQLQQQQQEAAAAAAAAATTANIVNTSVQTAMEQFQKQLQTQLVQDRNESTMQFFRTMRNQERTLTHTLGQPIHSTKEQMSVLQQQIQSLQQIFISPKSRGTFGEVQLELLIKDVLPATMYTMQYTLSNKKRVDCMLHLPSPIGNISIDSKFPTLTTNTSAMTTSTSPETPADITLPSSSSSSSISFSTSSSSPPQPSPQEQQNLRKKEIRDKLQKHINDIASKYIIPGETSPHAVCFIPSASLFLDIVTDHSDILLYAHRQNVWLTCPTTLLAVLTSIQGISRGQVVAQQTTNIFALITKLNKDIDLLVSRFEMAEKSVERTRNELSKMQTSVHKIQKVKMELDALSQTVSSPATLLKSSMPSSSRKISKDDPPPDLSNDSDDSKLNDERNNNFDDNNNNNNNNNTVRTEVLGTTESSVEILDTEGVVSSVNQSHSDSSSEKVLQLNGETNNATNPKSITIFGITAQRISTS